MKFMKTKAFDLPEHLAALTHWEADWRDKQTLLEYHGYMLRPRYHRGWVPSWTREEKSTHFPEDAIMNLPRQHIIDAARLSDGKLVHIGRVTTGDVDSTLASALSTEDLRLDERNHCIPVLDLFQDPGDLSVSYMVIPFLRHFDSPPLHAVHDVIELVDQILEGLAFLHEQGVAHRHCTYVNIMMDASSLYPHGFHPVHTNALPDGYKPAKTRSRDRQPVKYYFTSYKHAIKGPPDPELWQSLTNFGKEMGITELELQETAYDPYKVDIFMIGDMLQKQLCDKYSNLDFVMPLIQEMTRKRPASRPDAAEALQLWRGIARSIQWYHGEWVLRPRKRGSWTRRICSDVESLLRIAATSWNMTLVLVRKRLVLSRRWSSKNV